MMGAHVDSGGTSEDPVELRTGNAEPTGGKMDRGDDKRNACHTACGTWELAPRPAGRKVVLAVVYNLDLYQDDVGIESDTEKYMKQPRGFESGPGVCRLRRAIYGLKQSGRLWNKTLHADLVSMAWAFVNQNQTRVYTYGSREQRFVVGVYVDDLNIANNTTSQMLKLMVLLNIIYRMQGLERLHWVMGMRIMHDRAC
jgi:hypothetical protein